MALHMTVDDIIVSLILIHQIRKGSLDTGTLLIYRIIKRVHQAVHSLNDFIHIYSIPYLLIKLKKFFPIVYQIFEFNTFRVVQEEQIERLMDRTEGSPCCLNTKLFQYGHTDLSVSGACL